MEIFKRIKSNVAICATVCIIIFVILMLYSQDVFELPLPIVIIGTIIFVILASFTGYVLSPFYTEE